MSANSTLYLTRAQSRAVDEIAIREFGMLGLVLMENAGRNCAELILRFLEAKGEPITTSRILICCGKGNNGGDGFVIARHLAIAGADPTILLWAKPSELTSDAAANYQILAKSGSRFVFANAPEALSSMETVNHPPTIIIDALLGTGATGPARQPYAQAINWINAQNATVIAIDLPSGLDSETGEPHPPTIRATHTLTFVGQKTAFQNPAAAEFLGQMHVIDIGVPQAVINAALTH